MLNFLPTCISSGFPTVFFLNVFCISSPFFKIHGIASIHRQISNAGRANSFSSPTQRSVFLTQTKQVKALIRCGNDCACDLFTWKFSLQNAAPSRYMPFSYKYTFLKAFLSSLKYIQLLFYKYGVIQQFVYLFLELLQGAMQPTPTSISKERRN